ncbi:AarF/UbiB family protein [uncultured Cetobacterium sp.]|uniref:AarF/UbiB family protein n=1 Tax=uncultured Cetobacterium sp. TaxID=527638 RepID=UPI002607F826|nr:AarF/UbiB family protein [uncultured Cetobacterium sp.]
MSRIRLILLLKNIYLGKKPNLKEIEKLGLLAIKLCQYYALRIDFLDEEICMHLSKLYENSYFERKEKLCTIIDENEKWILTNFMHYENDMYTSASIGQIHTGILKHNMEKVAIKIRKRRSLLKFKRDIKVTKFLFKIAVLIYPYLNKIYNPITILEHIETTTIKELNFNNEVRGSEILRKLKKENEKSYDLEFLKFSRFYENLCSKKVLVSNFINGKSFNTLLNKDQLKYKDFIRFFKYHSYYIFKIGIFHGDIHPGNIILDKIGNIHLIDCSTIHTLKKDVRYNVFWFFYHISRDEPTKACLYINEFSIVKLEEKEYEDFLNSFLQLYDSFKNTKISQISLTKKTLEIIKLSLDHNLEFPIGMFHLLKSLMYIDGMLLKCHPNTTFMNGIKDFTDSIKKQMILENLEDINTF